MSLILGIFVWLIFAIYIRLGLIIIGIFFAVPLSLVSDGKYNTPKIWRLWANVERKEPWTSMSTWEKYVECAWRNPTPGLKGQLQQPIPEVKPNPDDIVRSGEKDSASRFMQDGLYWEYWYLRKMGDEYFEFRIGWKFVDGNDEFFPTLQLRKGG